MNLVRIAFKVSFKTRIASKSVKLLSPAKKARPSEDFAEIHIPFEIESSWSLKAGPYGDSKIGFRWKNEAPEFDMEHNFIMEEVPSIIIESIDGWELSSKDRKILEDAGLNDLVLASIFIEGLEGEIPKKSILDWIL